MKKIEKLRDIIQNKNFVMFFASLIFMCGILASFYGFAIVYCAVFTILILVLLYLRLFDIRKVLIFVFVFYFGFFLTFCKIKNYDELLHIVPVDISLSGRIVSIPEGKDDGKLKFFMQVEKAGDNEIDAKTFVTVTQTEKISGNLNIGEKVLMKGRLRKPFTSTNPSQFDYSSYLRNFNTFTTFYVAGNDVSILEDNPDFRWKFLREIGRAHV